MAEVFKLKLSELVEQRERWEALFLADSKATPFQSPTWQLAVHQYLRPTRSVLAVVSSQAEKWQSLALLERSHGIGRVWRSAGTGPSDYLSFLATKPDNQLTVTDLKQVLGAGGFDFSEWSSEGIGAQAFVGERGKKLLPDSKCLKLDLSSSWPDYFASLSKSLRTDFNRGDRNKALHIEINPPGAVNEFVKLHRLRWRKRGLPGAFSYRHLELHRHLVETAPEMFEISLLLRENRVIGALYSMHHKNRTYFYQSGIDPEFAKLSPGTILIGDSIRRAIARGDNEYDFLRGDEPYKHRWKPNRFETASRWIVFEKNLVGRSEALRREFFAKIEALLKARFEGRGLF